MAEIRVEKEKRGLGWLWALLALLLLALLAWWFFTQRPGSDPAPADTAAPIDTAAPRDTLTPADTLVPGDTAGDTVGALFSIPGSEAVLAYTVTHHGGSYGTT